MTMVSHLGFTDSAIDWFQGLLNSRFSTKLVLAQDNYCVTIRNPNGNGYVSVGPFIEGFQSCSSKLSCGSWEPEVEGFSTGVNSPIPMPGKSAVEGTLVRREEYGYHFDYDVFGLLYWMFCRIEENNDSVLDSHNRFPATESHAYKNNYLMRPIVDEWLGLMMQVVVKQWPQLSFSLPRFSISVSHDVDSPSLYAFKSWPFILRIMLSSVIKRFDLKTFILAPMTKMMSRRRLSSRDPFNTFSWLMDLSDGNSIRSTFYFICGQTDHSKDAEYNFDDPRIIHLVQEIAHRGHLIGLHPSYKSYLSLSSLSCEYKNLRSIMERADVSQPEVGSRMHYLRWKHLDTLYLLDKLGLAHDSTLGYADHPGFRCGTCHPYPAFDVTTQKIMNIQIRPLIVMESTVLEECYMGLGCSEQALDLFLDLKRKCQAVGGTFEFLWHNSSFTQSGSRELYKRILSD